MSSTLNDVCRSVARSVSLEEGPNGVEDIVRWIYQTGPISVKEVAARLGMPVPVVSAVRRELEKAGWLDRRGGMVLSVDARKEVEPIWGRHPVPVTGETDADDPDSEDYIPLPISEEPSATDEVFLELLEEIYEERPGADPRWDQSHATLDTVLRRAELFLDQGYIQGKRSLFLGDDDLTSVVTLLLARRLFGDEVLHAGACVVLEIDPRLVSFIQTTAMAEDLPIAVLETDLRNPLPESLSGAFDFFFTDPPYTAQGVDLFLDRGCQALAEKGLRRGTLAVPLSPPSLQIATQRSLFAKGFVLDYLEPRFNEYEGATMQGGVSALYGFHLYQIGRFDGAAHHGRLYTAQKKHHRRKQNRK